MHQEPDPHPAGGGGKGEEDHISGGSLAASRQRPVLRLREGRTGQAQHHAFLQGGGPTLFGQEMQIIKIQKLSRKITTIICR